jgi:hypothetical protein
MKALLGSGLCLALAFVSSQSYAQEVRSEAILPTLGKASPVVASSVTPVSYSQPASSVDLGIGLGKPIAVSGDSGASKSSEASPDFRPASLTLDRPVPLIRGQAPEITVQPMPLSGVTVASQPGRMVPVPVSMSSEYVSPRVVTDATPCGCSCGTVYATTAYPATVGIAECCTVLPVDDCGCGCGPRLGCAFCGDDCGYRGNRVYASVAYLGWAFERQNTPPLVTVSPFGTPQGMSGILGQPATTVLYGQGNGESDFHSGGRVNLGLWGPAGCWALEVDYLFLSQNSLTSTFGSNGDPQIGRPVIFNGQEQRQNVSQIVGLTTDAPQIGSVSVSSRSELWGIELDARQKLFCGPIGWIDMLYGYRHLDLSEGIGISENLTQVASSRDLTPQVGTRNFDGFNTRNVFNGGQIGIQGESHLFPYWFPRFFLGASAKVALGDMREQVTINGFTSTQLLVPTPGPVYSMNQGVLAQNTNIGNHTMDHFAVVPEFNLKLGLEINDHWRAWVGYDFLYMSNVVRPGDQIDRRLSQQPFILPNGSTVTVPFTGPGGAPAVLFKTSSFWAQGVSAGLQYRW